MEELALSISYSASKLRLSIILRHFLFAHRGCEVSILGRIQNLCGHSSEQPALVNTVLSKRIGLGNLPVSLPIPGSDSDTTKDNLTICLKVIYLCLPCLGPQSYANPHQH